MNPSLDRIDYSDTFRITNHFDSLSTIAKAIFGSGPKWVILLFKLRNQIVSFFGLKTAKAPNLTQELKVGSSIGLFKVFSLSNHQIILGEDDSHLNFRVLITNQNTSSQNISVTTQVEINNFFGKIYFTFIRPIHPLIVKALLKNIDK